MKHFILDSTYKDATVINNNDDISTIPSNNLPYNSLAHHTVYLSKTSTNYNINHNKNDKFNIYNIIDFL